MNTFIVVALIFAALLIFGVIYGIVNVSRTIDASRANPRRQEEHSPDGSSGLVTPLSDEQKETTRRYKDALARSGIPEARLRADIPPIDECDVEEEWVEELPTKAGTEWNAKTGDQDFRRKGDGAPA